MSDWTTTPPTVPGYYWLRNYKCQDGTSHQGPEVVHCPIDFWTGHLTQNVFFTGSDLSFGIDEFLEAEWYGPIEPPEVTQ